MASQVAWALEALVGQPVSVLLAGGETFEGVLASAKPDAPPGGPTLELRVVRPPVSPEGPAPTLPPEPSRKLSWTEIAVVTARDVDLSAEALGPRRLGSAAALANRQVALVTGQALGGKGRGSGAAAPAAAPDGSFATDGEISLVAGLGGQRELTKWVPEDGEVDHAWGDGGLEAAGGRAKGGRGPASGSSAGGQFEALGRTGGGAAGWDQFAANEAKFGVSTDYDEALYTTALDHDRAGITRAEADRIAREIETDTRHSRNVHMREERGLSIDAHGLDEEDLYGGVIREGALAREAEPPEGGLEEPTGAAVASSESLAEGPAAAAKGPAEAPTAADRGPAEVGAKSPGAGAREKGAEAAARSPAKGTGGARPPPQATQAAAPLGGGRGRGRATAQGGRWSEQGGRGRGGRGRGGRGGELGLNVYPLRPALGGPGGPYVPGAGGFPVGAASFVPGAYGLGGAYQPYHSYQAVPGYPGAYHPVAWQPQQQLGVPQPAPEAAAESARPEGRGPAGPPDVADVAPVAPGPAAGAAAATSPSATLPPPPSAIDVRREANKLRLQMTEPGKKSGSPYGTPKGLRSPLTSPLVGDSAKLEALDLHPGVAPVDEATRRQFSEFKAQAAAEGGASSPSPAGGSGSPAAAAAAPSASPPPAAAAAAAAASPAASSHRPKVDEFRRFSASLEGKLAAKGLASKKGAAAVSPTGSPAPASGAPPRTVASTPAAAPAAASSTPAAPSTATTAATPAKKSGLNPFASSFSFNPSAREFKPTVGVAAAASVAPAAPAAPAGPSARRGASPTPASPRRPGSGGGPPAGATPATGRRGGEGRRTRGAQAAAGFEGRRESGGKGSYQPSAGSRYIPQAFPSNAAAAAAAVAAAAAAAGGAPQGFVPGQFYPGGVTFSPTGAPVLPPGMLPQVFAPPGSGGGVQYAPQGSGGVPYAPQGAPAGGRATPDGGKALSRQGSLGPATSGGHGTAGARVGATPPPPGPGGRSAGGGEPTAPNGGTPSPQQHQQGEGGGGGGGGLTLPPHLAQQGGGLVHIYHPPGGGAPYMHLAAAPPQGAAYPAGGYVVGPVGPDGRASYFFLQQPPPPPGGEGVTPHPGAAQPPLVVLPAGAGAPGSPFPGAAAPGAPFPGYAVGANGALYPVATNGGPPGQPVYYGGGGGGGQVRLPRSPRGHGGRAQGGASGANGGGGRSKAEQVASPSPPQGSGDPPAAAEPVPAPPATAAEA